MTHPHNDVRIRIDGEERPLRLTLGALADIEDALGGDFEALKERLKRPRVGDVLLILHALLAGGGTTLSLEALRASKVDIAEAARAIGEAFAALEGDAPPGKPHVGES